MIANSRSGFKKTAIIPMPQPSTGQKRLEENGMWHWTNEVKPKEAAVQGSNPNIFLPISFQDSNSQSSQNFLLQWLFQKKARDLLTWSNQRSPFLHLERSQIQSNIDSSFALDSSRCCEETFFFLFSSCYGYLQSSRPRIAGQAALFSIKDVQGGNNLYL